MAMPPVKMSFKEFLGRQPEDVTPEDGQKRYDTYCEGFEGVLVKSYFDRHHQMVFMREKYDPLTIRKMQEAATANPVEAAATFASALDAESPASWPSYAYDGPAPKEPEAADDSNKAVKADDGKADEDKPAADEKDADAEKDTDAAAAAKPDLDKPLEAGLEAAAPVDPDSPAGIAARTLFVASLPRTLARSEAAELFAKEAGFVEVRAPYEVEPRMTRRLWATYATKEDAEKAHSAVDKKLVHHASGERLQVRVCAPRRWPPAPRLRLVPPESTKDERLSKDLEQSTAVMKAFDAREGIVAGGNPVVAALEGSATTEQKLDLVLWYLRDVHAFCYYTCTKLWWQWETQRRPPAPEVAAPEEPPAEETKPEAAADSTEATEEKPEDGGGSDDGEIAEPDKTEPKAAPDRRGVCFAFQKGECTRGDSCRFSHDPNGGGDGKKRKKGGEQFGDRLGLGFDVFGLSGNWEEILDKRCAKIIEAAAAAEPDSEYLAKCARTRVHLTDHPTTQL